MRGIWIFDSKTEELKAVLSNENPGACPYWEDKQTERLDEALLTYEFSCPADRPEAREITGEDLIAVRDLDGYFVLFVAREVTEESGEQPTKRVFCENAALELGGVYVRPQTFAGVTAEQALNAVLDGTRWQLGDVEWLGTRDIAVKDYMTVIALLHEMRKAFAGEFRYRVTVEGNKITGRYIDLLARRGQDTGKRFEYAKDTKGIKRIENTEEVATALIGLGKADSNGVKLTFKNVAWAKPTNPADKPLGQDWVGDEEAFQAWAKDGRHIEGIFEDSEETDPVRLLQKTWDALQERKNSKYTYEVDAVLLERVAGLEHEAVRLGDTVRVIDRTFDPPLTLEARVVELERSYSDPSADKVVLGYYRERLTSTAKVIADLQALISQKEGIWETGETISKGPTPPASPKVDDLWLDTSQTPNVWKRWNGSAWVKATPTQAQEVGAETPEGAQAKADAALASATSFTEQYAERKVTVGTTPPTTPATHDLWLDYNFAPPVWKQWNGTAWVTITRSDLSQLTGQISANQVAANIITTNHISTAGLDAGVIKTGTMVADRVYGGTLRGIVIDGVTIYASQVSQAPTISTTQLLVYDPQYIEYGELSYNTTNGFTLYSASAMDIRADYYLRLNSPYGIYVSGNIKSSITIEGTVTIGGTTTLNAPLVLNNSLTLSQRLRADYGVSSASPLRTFANTDPIMEITDAAGGSKGYIGYITSSVPNGIWIRNAVAGTILCLGNDGTLKFYNGTSWRTL